MVLLKGSVEHFLSVVKSKTLVGERETARFKVKSITSWPGDHGHLYNLSNLQFSTL